MLSPFAILIRNDLRCPPHRDVQALTDRRDAAVSAEPVPELREQHPFNEEGEDSVLGRVFPGLCVVSDQGGCAPQGNAGGNLSELTEL